ncbi:MAG TPA: DUF5668 domain-containing protein [Bacteroidales bacterium]|nr:DUF5668 domain-containing protein [Bacteroidales bacterium]
MRHIHHHAEIKCSKHPHSKVRGFVFGFFLLAAGTLLLLGNAGVIDKTLFKYIFSWQSLLIALGVIFLSGGIRKHWFGALVLITIGTLFLLDEIYTFKTGIANMIWPAILVIVGIAVMVKIFLPKKSHWNIPQDGFRGGLSEETNSEDYFDISKVFSGAHTVVKSQNFKGGNASFIFGGGEIDFRNAQLSEGTNILKLECIFGGVKIFVPDTWDVSLETTGIFGGFSDERRHLNIENIDKSRRLVIKGEAVFGGGEISN